MSVVFCSREAATLPVTCLLYGEQCTDVCLMLVLLSVHIKYSKNFQSFSIKIIYAVTVTYQCYQFSSVYFSRHI